MIKSPIIFVFLALGQIAMGCGGAAVNGGEDYGNILNSPDGLTLTQGEHEIGWGNSQCTLCHNLENIHLVDRSGIGIDVDAIHEQALEDGIGGCAVCHGTNGT